MSYNSNRLCILKIVDGSSMGLSHEFRREKRWVDLFPAYKTTQSSRFAAHFYVIFYDIREVKQRGVIFTKIVVRVWIVGFVEPLIYPPESVKRYYEA